MSVITCLHHECYRLSSPCVLSPVFSMSVIICLHHECYRLSSPCVLSPVFSMSVIICLLHECYRLSSPRMLLHVSSMSVITCIACLLHECYRLTHVLANCSLHWPICMLTIQKYYGNFPLHYTRWLPGFARVPYAYYAPIMPSAPSP